MDRKIVIEVNGSYLVKDSDMAGVVGEGNSTYMNIIFDESWLDYAKTVTFWDAKGQNPVKRVLTADYLTEPIKALDYTIPIPAEPLAYQGRMTFVIDGAIDGARKRSVSDELKVRYAPQADDALDPEEVTPSQIEQLQQEIDSILPDMIAERVQAQEAKETAVNAAEEAVASLARMDELEASARESAETASSAKVASESAKDTAVSSAQVASEAATSANLSAQTALSSASDASASANSAAIYSTQTQDYAAAAGIAAANAKTAETNASASALSALTSMESATASKDRAVVAESNAKVSEDAAKEAQRLAEKARDEAQGISGGDFASRAEAQGYADTAEANAKAYTDRKVANIPTPDVSGQINAHNDNTNAHPSIRTALTGALAEAKSYTDQKVASIPTPDVSGQIGTHNSNESAHPYIRGLIDDLASDVNTLGQAVSANTTAIGQKASQSDLTSHTGNANIHVTAEEKQKWNNVDFSAIEEQVQEVAANVADKAPMYTYGTEDLEAGVTPLETGKLHFVYE